MIWALLAFVGVPLWLCALGILALVYRNLALRSRHGNISVRVLRPGKTHWIRGRAVWVSDVFAWRGSPAAWNEYLELILDAQLGDHARGHHGGARVGAAGPVRGSIRGCLTRLPRARN